MVQYSNILEATNFCFHYGIFVKLWIQHFVAWFIPCESITNVLVECKEPELSIPV